MSLLWYFYWPAIVAAFVIGILAGRIGFFKAKISDEAPEARKVAVEQAYRARRRKSLLAGLAAVLAATAIWHWPLGAAERFATTVERVAREEFQRLEMPEINAVAARSPLRRVLIVSGPANDFQQAEFLRILETAPGIAAVRWQGQAGPRFEMPMLGEVALLALLALLAGLGFSYLVEIRRRVNAEWSW